MADTIMASPDTYSEVVLGKPPREYAEWIVDPHHWGGQIELTVRARLEENFKRIGLGALSARVWGRGAQVLCQHYCCLISCVDVQSLRVDQYGEGSGYQRRVLLIYDGIHYDPLSCAPAAGGEV